MLKNSGKKTIVIATANAARKANIDSWAQKNIQEAVVYSAGDYLEAITKIKNVPPFVVFMDMDLPKGKPGQLAETIIADEALKATAIVIISALPQQERFLDELVTGKVQFLSEDKFESEFGPVISKALAYSGKDNPTDFFLKFIKPKETLIKEGDKGEQVYIVKKGQLTVYQNRNGKRVDIGKIEAGEFVGEMAYFNGEPRMATVEAVTDCELIEIPIGTFERVLYQRPAWSRALLQTLSKRLRKIAPPV